MRNFDDSFPKRVKYHKKKTIKNKVYRKKRKVGFIAKIHLWFKHRSKKWKHRQKFIEERKHLGHRPLNKHFKYSEFHHLIVMPDGTIDFNVGIYIPKEMHRGVKHSARTGRGLLKINKLAWNYLNKHKER